MNQYFKRQIELTEECLESTEKKKGLQSMGEQKVENQKRILENQSAIMKFLQRNVKDNL